MWTCLLALVLQARASAVVNTTDPSQPDATLQPTPTPSNATTQDLTQSPASIPTQTPPQEAEDVPPEQPRKTNNTEQSEDPIQAPVSPTPAARTPKPSSAPSGHEALPTEPTPVLPQPQPLRSPQGRTLPKREEPAPRKRSLLPNKRVQRRPQQYSGSESNLQGSNGPRGHTGGAQKAQDGKVRCHCCNSRD